MKKYLGLDLGTKTLGIAYNDVLGFVHGLETFRFDKNQYIVARKHVIELSEKMMINDIVIGLPLHLSGEESEMSQNVKRFIEDLKKEKPALNIETMDERLSSVTANKSTRQTSRVPLRWTPSPMPSRRDSSSAVLPRPTW